MAIVTKSIGTASRDYSTITAWEADLDNVSVYGSGDDAVGECYNDSSFSETITISGGSTTGINSVTLTVQIAERHDGTEGTGVNLNGSLLDDNSAPSGKIIEWIDVNQNDYCSFYGSNLIRNCLFHDYSTVSSSSIRSAAVNLNRGFTTVNHIKMMNCIIYNATQSGGGSRSMTGLRAGEDGRSGSAYNCTIFNINCNGGTGGAIGVSCGMRGGNVQKNIISMDVGGTSSGNKRCFSYEYVASAGVVDNFVASDSTAGTYATTYFNNQTSSDQFVSTVGGSEDLHLKVGSIAIGSGSDIGTWPAGVEIDIDGYDRDAGNRTWDIGADQAPGTITKTIGTSSRDYSTITAWEADLDDSIIYMSGDDAVGECYNDSDFDERLQLNGGGTVGLASVTLTAAATDRHDGTAGSGAKIKVTSLASYHELGADVSWLEFDNNGVTLSGSSFDFGSSPTGSIRYSNLLIHDVQSTFTTGDRPPIAFSTLNNTDIVNCIIYDIDSACSGIGGVELGISSRTYRIANCTFHDIANSHPTADHYGIYDRGINSFENCIVTDATVSGSGTAYCLQAALTDSYCLTSDATADGTGSLINKASADQFVSTVGGSEDLHLKAGADAIDAGTDLGTTPSGVEIDINGYDRDAGGVVWDIGAHEYFSASTPVTAIFIIPDSFHSELNNLNILNLEFIGQISTTLTLSDGFNSEISSIDTIDLESNQSINSLDSIPLSHSLSISSSQNLDLETISSLLVNNAIINEFNSQKSIQESVSLGFLNQIQKLNTINTDNYSEIQLLSSILNTSYLQDIAVVNSVPVSYIGQISSTSAIPLSYTSEIGKVSIINVDYLENILSAPVIPLDHIQEISSLSTIPISHDGEFTGSISIINIDYLQDLQISKDSPLSYIGSIKNSPVMSLDYLKNISSTSEIPIVYGGQFSGSVSTINIDYLQNIETTRILPVSHIGGINNNIVINTSHLGGISYLSTIPLVHGGEFAGSFITIDIEYTQGVASTSTTPLSNIGGISASSDLDIENLRQLSLISSMNASYIESIDGILNTVTVDSTLGTGSISTYPLTYLGGISADKNLPVEIIGNQSILNTVPISYRTTFIDLDPVRIWRLESRDKNWSVGERDRIWGIIDRNRIWILQNRKT